MGERIKWIEHKGKLILFTDYSELSGREYVEAIKKNTEIVRHDGKRHMLNLLNVENSHIDKDVMRVSRELAVESKHYFDRVAVLGVGGVEEVILRFLNLLAGTSFRAFKTREAALDWLVE